MHLAPASQAFDSDLRRVLVVADWKVDPRTVVYACSHQHNARPASFALLVPARLHGLDWVGDPYASLPCATQALADLAALFDRAGLPVHSAEVGYHDPIAAIMDATLDQSVDEILLCERKRRLPSHPFDLPHRARGTTALPVIPMSLAAGTTEVRAHVWWRFRQGHCPLSEAAAAT